MNVNAEIIRLLLQEQDEEAKEKVETFEDNPMEFILRKYQTLNAALIELMSESYREYLDAVFIVAPKPTSFKIVLHNGQYFYLTYMGPVYEASVSGKKYYLSNVGEKERCMLAISKLLRKGIPATTKGPDGAEQGSNVGGDTDESESGLSASSEEEGAPSPEGEESLTEIRLIEAIIKKKITNTRSGSRGLFGRKIGDIFSNGNQNLEFEGVEMYPKEGKAFNSKEEMDKEIQKINKIKKIEFVNAGVKQNSLAFAVAQFKNSETQQKVLWGKYYKQKPNNLLGSWSNSEIPPGYKLQIRSAKKYQVGITPQKLIGTEKPFSLEEAIKKVEENLSNIDSDSRDTGLDDSLIQALEQIKEKKLPIFEAQAEYESAIRDNFGEIMAPMAVISGLAGGQLLKAEQSLLGSKDNKPKEKFSECQVSWPLSANQNLLDSYLISPSGVKIGISSKGGIGASASVKGLYDTLSRIPQNDPYRENYKKLIETITIIHEKDYKEGIFELAKKYNVFAEQLEKGLKKEILDHIEGRKKSADKLSEFAEELKRKQRGSARIDNKQYNIGNLLLSILAKEVAKKINEDAGTEFSDGVKKMFNYSSIIQVYCNTTKKGDDVHVTEFKVAYPPKVEGNVELDAGKNYASTQIKGKLSFIFR